MGEWSKNDVDLLECLNLKDSLLKTNTSSYGSIYMKLWHLRKVLERRKEIAGQEDREWGDCPSSRMSQNYK